MGEDFISLRQNRYFIEPEVGPTLSGHPRGNELILSTPQQVGLNRYGLDTGLDQFDFVAFRRIDEGDPSSVWISVWPV